MRMISRCALSGALIVTALLALAGCGTGSGAGRQDMTSQQRVFDELDRYGTWIDIPAYGTVWQPRVSPDWRPYTYGHWVWSDNGWVWVGYEPFAWIVYHYGSWYDDRGYGWVWVPAYDWAPAQVAWATSDDYIAWAPLPPQGAQIVQPGDPYWDQMWVLVPVARFRQQDVGKYNTGQNTVGAGRVRGGTGVAPDFNKVREMSAGENTPMKIDLEKVSVEGRNLLRLKLPPDQEKIVDARAAEMRTNVLVPGTKTDNGTPKEQQRVRPAEAPVRETPAKNDQPVKPRSVETPPKQPAAIDNGAVKPAPSAPVRKVEKAKPASTEKKPAPAKGAKPAPKTQTEKPKSEEAKDTPK